MLGDGEQAPQGRRTVLRIFATFLWLGLSAFGGPISHLAYFREALVVRRGWLGDSVYAELVALCQFLPGPSSSQTAYAIGVRRAGIPGGLAAWFGFSLPSVILMTGFAYLQSGLHDPLVTGAVDGLKLVAVAVVAQAVVGMARGLTPDLSRLALAALAGLIVLLAPFAATQLGVIATGGLAGAWLAKPSTAPSRDGSIPVPSRRISILALCLFVLLLTGGPVARLFLPDQTFAVADAFYRAGALVFGGGHVVLPLLHEAVVAPGWLSEDVFLAGYGAAQAMPGPLFSFAAFLGAAFPTPPNAVWGASLAFLALSLPGLLLVTAALPWWDRLRVQPRAAGAVPGAGVAVVGVLAAALCGPIWSEAIRSGADLLAVAAGFALLMAMRLPPLGLVVIGAAVGVLRAALAL